MDLSLSFWFWMVGITWPTNLGKGCLMPQRGAERCGLRLWRIQACAEALHLAARSYARRSSWFFDG